MQTVAPDSDGKGNFDKPMKGDMQLFEIKDLKNPDLPIFIMYLFRVSEKPNNCEKYLKKAPIAEAERYEGTGARPKPNKNLKPKKNMKPTNLK